MGRVIVEMLALVLVINSMFQPILSEVYSLRSYAVEMILDAGIEKAAAGDNGRFTPEIISEMRKSLNKIGYSDAEIKFTGTTTLTGRGNYIEGNLEVPHQRLWIMQNLFVKDTFNKKISKYAKQMSEYIIR